MTSSLHSANIGTLDLELNKQNVCLFYNVFQKCSKLKGECSKKTYGICEYYN